MLNVEYTDSAPTRSITAKWRDEDGPLVEQFRVSGLGGNDFIEFAQGVNALKLDELNARSDDFVGVIDGGPGNDIQFGTSGRDRFDGGEGSDILFGLGGDDRLFGDGGTAPATDYDRLFGGQGHDDLIGGQGTNDLYAWSQNPNVAFTELQFALGVTTADPADSISSAALIGLAPLPALGRLSGDAKFSLSVGNGHAVNVTVLARDTRESAGAVGDANFTRADLVTDINQALTAAGLGNQVTAGLTADGKLTLTGGRTDSGQPLTLDTGGFGVFVQDPKDPDSPLFTDDGDTNNDGQLDSDPAKPARVIEDTGLNRVLGAANADRLYGGSGLDFLFGNGGADSLFRADGSAFESLDGGLTGDEWKQYARETNKVWYYSGTNLNDIITVDFVTEPGLLQEHHVITRLTENNGNFTFDAQVDLDFQAKDAAGNLIWDQQDVLFDPEQGGLVNPRDLGGLLPPEGDFLAIIIDALDGNDKVTVGPTVVKTVWVDAGAGDDQVEIASGSPILIDGAERPQRNDTPANAFDLGTVASSTIFTGLTLDSPQDEDWYAFRPGSTPRLGDTIAIAGLSRNDRLKLQIRDTADKLLGSVDADLETGRASLDLGALGLQSGVIYRLRVFSDQVPTAYDIGFSMVDTGDLAEPNDTQATAFEIDEFEHLSRVSGLALRSASDVDFYRFQLSANGRDQDRIRLQSLTGGATLTMQLLDQSGDGAEDLRCVGPDHRSHRPGRGQPVLPQDHRRRPARYRIVPMIGEAGSEPVDLEGFQVVNLSSTVAILRARRDSGRRRERRAGRRLRRGVDIRRARQRRALPAAATARRATCCSAAKATTLPDHPPTPCRFIQGRAAHAARGRTSAPYADPDAVRLVRRRRRPRPRCCSSAATSIGSAGR